MITVYDKIVHKKLNGVDIVNIGITGSIACGKSTVSNYLRDKGYTIIDADKLGHTALTDDEVREKLEKSFGLRIIENNEISREKLGKLVFGNEENLKILNSIVHPYIRNIGEINPLYFYFPSYFLTLMYFIFYSFSEFLITLKSSIFNSPST